jgi:acetylornithine deacetylase
VTALVFDTDRFVELLGDLVALGPRLQNSPDANLVPEERLAAERVLARLAPHLESRFMKAELLAEKGHEKRPNLVLTVPGTGRGSIGFVGAHFDVVPADREKEGWERDPFRLHVSDAGMLYGRGVTDCLGHVALLTELLASMAERGVRPEKTLKVVLISNEEEAPLPEIGLDYAVSAGALDDIKDGTLYWLDSADFGPTVGTGGMAMWELHVDGVPGHSGMTHNCVNALELGMAASRALVEWFDKSYPPHADEARWGFVSPSTLKSTVIRAENDKITKIPGSVVLEGDIRLTPFYDIVEAMRGAQSFVADLDRRLEADDPPRGFPRTRTVGGQRGRLRLVPKGRSIDGIACSLDSPGLSALTGAIKRARPGAEVKQHSITGSLPLVRALQKQGFDVQITGFGRSVYYHAPNEQAELAHFEQGFAILSDLLGV